MDFEALMAKLDAFVAKADTTPTSDDADLEAKIAAIVDAKLNSTLEAIKQNTEMMSKAFTSMSREGTGRVGQAGEDEFENDPVAFLVKKGFAETDAEKAVAVAIFKEVVGEGLMN